MAAKKEKTYEGLIRKMSLLNFEMGSRFYAKATHIVDPHDFYILPFSLLHYLPLVSKPGEPTAIEHLKKGDVVVFDSKNPNVNAYFNIDLDTKIRGIVEEINEDKKCRIYALDRGYTEEDVTIDRIFRPATEDAINMPSLIKHCKLSACVPIGPNFSPESIEAFKFYIGTEKLTVTVRGKTDYKLNITVHNRSPEEVATSLALMEFTSLPSFDPEDVDADNAILAPLKHIEVSYDQSLIVRVQSGSSLGSFYVAPITEFNNYKITRPLLTAVCKVNQELDPEDFVNGKVVGVLNEDDEFYERAVILNVLNPDTAIVKLLDWGTELEEAKSRMRPLPIPYSTNPAIALYCSAIDECTALHYDFPDFLYEGRYIKIKVEKIGRGFIAPHVVYVKKITSV